MIENVVIATDGSESGTRARAVALDLANRFGATIHALYVVDTDEVDSAPEAISADLHSALRAQAETALSAVSDRTDREVVTAVREGRPEVEITTYAREHGIDLVAIGTRGRHGEHRFLLGSVAEAVVRTCPVPVLTVRQLGEE